MQALSPAAHLKLYGYCLLEDVLAPARADVIAADCLRWHAKLKGQPNLQSEAGIYETLFGVMNHSESAWELPVHPAVLDPIEELLGKDAQLCEATSKIVRPGYKGQTMHSDGENAEVGYGVLAHVNTMWMLTDFTLENGATAIVPFSQFARQPCPREITCDNKHVFKVTGRKGTLFMWNGGAWHGAGPSLPNAPVRIGLNASYTIGWFNVRDKNHIKVRPEVFQRMPPRLQEKLRRQQSNFAISDLPDAAFNVR